MNQEARLALRQRVQDTYAAWREIERNAASLRGGGYASDYQRERVREAAQAYTEACQAAGMQASPTAIEAAKLGTFPW